MNKTILYFLAGLALLVALITIFSNIFVYISVSLVLSSILRPITNYVDQAQLFNFKMPRVFAVLISFLGLTLLLSSFILLFVPLVAEQIQVISKINYDSLFEFISRPFYAIEDFMLGNNLTQEAPGFIVNDIKKSVVSLITGLNFTSLLNNIISFTGNFFIGFLAVIFITFVMLLEKDVMQNKLISIIPNKYFEVTIVVIYKIEKLFSNYLLGLLFQMFSIFSIAALGLTILGVNYALTIALFAALANLIPYAGPILGAIFGVIVGLSTSEALIASNDYIILVAKIAGVFMVVQLTDNMILQPLIFSKSVKAHPLEIFVIIFAGATLAGIVGMVAAIPVYTVLRVTIMELYNAYKQYHIFKQ